MLAFLTLDDGVACYVRGRAFGILVSSPLGDSVICDELVSRPRARRTVSAVPGNHANKPAAGADACSVTQYGWTDDNGAVIDSTSMPNKRRAYNPRVIGHANIVAAPDSGC